MTNWMLALLVPALFLATALADAQPCPPFDGGVAQTVVRGGTNVTLFAAGFYERPDGPPETRGAKWIPGRKRNLCSVSTFSGLGSFDGADGGDLDERGKDNIEDDNGSGRRADTNDCIPLYDWVSSHSGHWVIPQRNLRSSPLLVLGSCAVSTSVRREWRSKLPWGVAVSSEDVKRVLREVLEKYRVAKGTGGRGDMGCLGWKRWEPVAVPVDWRIAEWDGSS